MLTQPTFQRLRTELVAVPFGFKWESRLPNGELTSKYEIVADRPLRIIGRSGDVLGLRACEANIGDRMLFASRGQMRCGVALSLFRHHVLPTGMWLSLVIVASQEVLQGRHFGLIAERVVAA